MIETDLFKRILKQQIKRSFTDQKEADFEHRQKKILNLNEDEDEKTNKFDKFCNPSNMIQCIIIDHTSFGAQCWKKFIDYLSLVSSFSYATYAAFRQTSKNMKMYIGIVELFYLLDMILTFITDYPRTSSSNQKVHVKDINKIFWRYIKGDFIKNLVALIPFWLISMPNHAEAVFFMLKLFGRLERGLNNMDVYKIMEVYQLNEYRRLNRLIKSDPKAASSMDSDQICIN